MLRSALQQATSLLKGMNLAPALQHQPIRNAIIMRRMYPPRLRKKGHTKTLKRREYVYIMEENTSIKPWGDMQVILSRDVEGIGYRGDLVTVRKHLARNKLLPGGLAVYASPENIQFYEEEKKNSPPRPRQSIWAQKTIRALEGMNLNIPMNPHVPWTLNKTHVRVAFRKCGVELSEDCLTLPPEPITEPQNFTLKVLVNGLEDVAVKAIIYHWYPEAKDYPGGEPPDLPPVFTKSKRPIIIPKDSIRPTQSQQSQGS